MNEFTHFFSAYLVARALRKKEDRFECFFIACAGVLVDIDSTINMFIPFEHGVFTHTYIGGMLFELIFTIIAYFCARNLLKKTHVSFWQLLFLAFMGLTTHFFLDIFTFHPGPCSIWLNPDLLPAECALICPGPECVSADDYHHLYFWPFWNFPPHLNTIFPYTWMTYEVRVWLEVIWSVALGFYIIYRWFIKRENIIGFLSPAAWWKYANQNDDGKTAQNSVKLPNSSEKEKFLSFLTRTTKANLRFSSEIPITIIIWELVWAGVALFGILLLL